MMSDPAKTIFVPDGSEVIIPEGYFVGEAQWAVDTTFREPQRGWHLLLLPYSGPVRHRMQVAEAQARKQMEIDAYAKTLGDPLVYGKFGLNSVRKEKDRRDLSDPAPSTYA